MRGQLPTFLLLLEEILENIKVGEKYCFLSSLIPLQFEGEEWRDPTNMREIVPLAQTLRLYSTTPLLPSSATDSSQENQLIANNLLVSFVIAAPIIASLLNHKSEVN